MTRQQQWYLLRVRVEREEERDERRRVEREKIGARGTARPSDSPSVAQRTDSF